MGRLPRVALGERVYHVRKRANGRHTLLTQEADDAAFAQGLAEAAPRVARRGLASGVMLHHWPLVLWPRANGDLSRCVGWLTLAHTQRWHAHHHTTGTGHLYQGRFKSLPIQTDEHVLTVCRYVERHPVRAGLVPQAQDWRWGSLWYREQRHAAPQGMLSPWPVDQPVAWGQWVNEPLPHEELQALRRCVNRGQPFGHAAWQEQTAVQLGLASTFRPRGRPRQKLAHGV